jgi:hypothetical protein
MAMTNFSLCLTEHKDMSLTGEWRLAPPFLTWPLDAGRPFYSWEGAPGGLVSPRIGPDHVDPAL